ncbi:MAG: helix-turn-helix domain-containing protein [Calothrix sp. MO_192.B10]|nr:helix-turn-helix domain-containing protein [Calothrix sp. MO_192.B10]
MVSLYLISIAGNPAVEISQDELRSLLGEIEAVSDSSLEYQQNSKLPKRRSQQIEAQPITAEQPIEVLRQIGQQLRQARESQGLSLIEISCSTYIPMSHIESIEKGNLELLPDDVFVRSFIKMMGNSLGLDGESLAASLPADDKTKPFLKPSEQTTQSSSQQWRLKVSPIHLYIGYATLVASAIGGLSFISGQSTTRSNIYSDRVTPSTLSLSDSSGNHQGTTKPGIKSNNRRVNNMGIDIAPPEELQ